MFRLTRWPALLAWTSCVFAAMPGAGAAPAADHPLVGRYEGATLLDHHASDYDEVSLIDGPIAGSSRGAGAPGWLALEGRSDLYYYALPAGRSTLEVLRNYEAALGQRGFEVLFTCATSNGSCYQARPNRAADTMPYDFALAFDAAPELPRLNGDFIRNYFRTNARYLLARLARAEAATYASVVLAEAGDRGNFAFVRIVETKAMSTGKIVVVGARQMHDALANDGRISLYGIRFDFDRDAIRPESAPTLDEIARLLEDDPALRLSVVGHTDSQGGAAYNLALSGRRAAAVVAELARRGIDRARLSPRGAGMGEPVASNDSEDGRAKNRRVELVRRP